MKKIMLLVFLTFILCCFTGCEVDFEKHPECISVVVSGVDNGIVHCKYVCEFEDSYAYYDSGVIYYFENSESEPYEIECPGLEYMDMDGEHIYYTQGSGLRVFNKESKEVTKITEMGEVSSIDALMDEVLVLCYEDDIGRVYYKMSGDDICKVDLEKNTDVFVSSTHTCVNSYNSPNTYVYLDGNIYKLDGEGYKMIDKNGEEGEFHEYHDISLSRYSSPALMAMYDEKIYVLQQGTRASGSVGLNMTYAHKEWEHLICVDLSTETIEILYKTEGPEEQLVNYSVENDEMFLLIEGVLYKTNLKGENKKELADLTGIAQTLSFDYANDTLFVYDGEKLIGQYK